MGRGAIPKSPEIFERGVYLSVKEGVLQAVGLVASKAVGDIHHVAWLQPLALAYHRYEWIFLAFPGNPVVPADVAPSERFVANFELRLRRERMADRIRCLPELSGHTLERVEIYAICIDILKKPRNSNLRRCRLCSCVYVAVHHRQETFTPC